MRMNICMQHSAAMRVTLEDGFPTSPAQYGKPLEHDMTHTTECSV
jgi:hypothetical protein